MRCSSCAGPDSPHASARAQATDPIAARAAEGAAAMRAGRFDAAATIYAELTTARPDDAGLLMNLGMARYMAGHPDRGARSAPEIRPPRPVARARVAVSRRLTPRSRSARGGDSCLFNAPSPPCRRMQTRGRCWRARTSTRRSSRKPRSTTVRCTTIQPRIRKPGTAWLRSYEGIAEKALNALQQQAPDSPLLELVVADVAVSQEKYRGCARDLSTRAGGHAAGRRAARSGRRDLRACRKARMGRSGAARRQAASRRPSAPAASRSATFSPAGFASRSRPALQSPTPAGRYWTIRAANRLATEAVARLETLPPSVELHLIRAELAQSGGRNTEAVTEVRAALELSPGNPAHRDRARRGAAAGAQRGRGAAAARAAEPRTSGRCVAAAPCMATRCCKASRSSARSRFWSAPLATKDAPVAAHAALGRAYVQVGRYEEALPHLIVASKGDQDGDVHLQLARALPGARASRRRAEGDDGIPEIAPASGSEQSRARQALTPPKIERVDRQYQTFGRALYFGSVTVSTRFAVT